MADVHNASTASTDFRDVYEQERDFLWGYCYRLTGSAADAEDVVQETFVRALESPPTDQSRPWRPWLLRVAINLVRDAARRRARRDYVGPWLPSPVDTGPGSPFLRPPDPDGPPDARYEWLESASMAFLLALEVLNPRQRAVLLLRDVYDASVAETAEILALSEANVKTTLHRARKALDAYDRRRRPPDAERIRRAGDLLGRFLERLASHDTSGVEALLSQGVEALSDGGGRFYAARKPVLGRQKVALLYTRIQPAEGETLHWEIRSLNGLPALVAVRPDAPEGHATRFVLAVEPSVGDGEAVDDEAAIGRIYSVLAPDKLTAVSFPG